MDSQIDDDVENWILVSGISENSEEQDLELIFESRQQEGGETDSIKLLGSGKALIKFVDVQVAENFCRKEKIVLDRTEMVISRPPLKNSTPDDSSETCDQPHYESVSQPVIGSTLLVRSQAALPGKEMMKLYFESRRIAEAEVISIQCNNESNEAVITFRDSKDVEKVLKKGSKHKVSGVELHLFVVESFPELAGISSCAIEVTGIDKKTTEDNLLFFFESPRINGGLVEEILYNNEGKAVITFESSDVAIKVSENTNLEIDKTRLSVKHLASAPPPLMVVGDVDSEKILVKLLPEGYLDDELKEFLNKASGLMAQTINRSSLSIDVALAVFPQPPDYIGLRTYVATKPFKGRMISVQRMPSCSCIIIYPTDSISTEAPMYYFENEKRSGGGEIKNYEPNLTDDYTVIEFVDRKAISNVMSRQHKMEGKTLNVEWYYPDLGPPPNILSSKPKPKIPDEIPEKTKSSTTLEKTIPVDSEKPSPGSAITVDSEKPSPGLAITVPEFCEITLIIDSSKIQFILKNQNYKRAIENELLGFNCKIIWPTSLLDDGKIILGCSLPSNKRDKLIDNWNKVCSDIMIKFCEKIISVKLRVPQDIFSEFVCEAIKSVGDELEFEPNKETSTIECIGSCTQVVRLQKISSCLIEKLEKNSKVSDMERNLPPYKIALLKLSKFDQNVSQDLKVTFSEREVAFHGKKSIVDDGRMKMQEVLSGIVSNLIEVSQNIVAFLAIENNRKYIFECFKDNSILAVYELIGNDAIHIHALGQQNCKGAVHIITTEIVEKVVDLDDEKKTTLTMPPWENLKKKKVPTATLR